MNRRNSLKVGASLIAGLSFISKTKAAGSYSLDESSNDFFDVIKSRRSVRKFKSDAVPEKDLVKIVDAARMAPTAGNQQPWKFLIVQGKDQVDKLKKEALSETEQYFKETKKLSGNELNKKLEQAKKRLDEGYLSAPAYIVVLTDNNSKYPKYNDHDGPLAAGYLLLAARALGYGTVYITDAIPESATKKAFDIPDNYKRVCITPVGVPYGWPTKGKKELGEFIVKDSF